MQKYLRRPHAHAVDRGPFPIFVLTLTTDVFHQIFLFTLTPIRYVHMAMNYDVMVDSKSKKLYYYSCTRL
jgi:hypothetical protein